MDRGGVRVVVMLVVFIIIVHFSINIIRVILVKLVNVNFINLKIDDGVQQFFLDALLEHRRK